jgi:hypothetical protein
MGEKRKKPVWPWIVALLIGLPVLYVVSFGPACWLTDRGVIPEELACQFYDPLAVVMVRCCSDQICEGMSAYGTWGSKSESGLALIILIERVRLLMDDRP